MWAREKKDALLEYRLYSPAGAGQAWAVRVQVDAAAPRSVVVTELLKARSELRGMKPPRLASGRAEEAVDAVDGCEPLPALPATSPVIVREPDTQDEVLPSDLAQMVLF
jgi:hypothetical protein